MVIQRYRPVPQKYAPNARSIIFRFFLLNEDGRPEISKFVKNTNGAFALRSRDAKQVALRLWIVIVVYPIGCTKYRE